MKQMRIKRLWPTMPASGSVDGLRHFIQDKKKSTTVGGNMLFWPEWPRLAVATVSQHKKQNNDLMSCCRRETHDSSRHHQTVGSLTNEEEWARFKTWQKVPGNTQEIQQQGKIEGSILINTVAGPAQCLVHCGLSINADLKLNDVFKNVAVPAVCAPQSLQLKSHWCGLNSVCPPKKA